MGDDPKKELERLRKQEEEKKPADGYEDEFYEVDDVE